MNNIAALGSYQASIPDVTPQKVKWVHLNFESRQDKLAFDEDFQAMGRLRDSLSMEFLLKSQVRVREYIAPIKGRLTAKRPLSGIGTPATEENLSQDIHTGLGDPSRLTLKEVPSPLDKNQRPTESSVETLSCREIDVPVSQPVYDKVIENQSGNHDPVELKEWEDREEAMPIIKSRTVDGPSLQDELVIRRKPLSQDPPQKPEKYLEIAELNAGEIELHNMTTKPDDSYTYAIALCDFEPEEDNNELAFKEGDDIEIVEKTAALAKDGWCRARVKGHDKLGVVPLLYLKIGVNATNSNEPRAPAQISVSFSPSAVQSPPAHSVQNSSSASLGESMDSASMPSMMSSQTPLPFHSSRPTLTYLETQALAPSNIVPILAESVEIKREQEEQFAYEDAWVIYLLKRKRAEVALRELEHATLSSNIRKHIPSYGNYDHQVKRTLTKSVKRDVIPPRKVVVGERSKRVRYTSDSVKETVQRYLLTALSLTAPFAWPLVVPALLGTAMSRRFDNIARERQKPRSGEHNFLEKSSFTYRPQGRGQVQQ
jgi:hypothetical protein